MGRRDYEGAPIEGVRGNVAGSTTSDYGSRNFTGSERFEFNNEDDGGSVTGPTPRPPKTGLTKAQFENRFGITDRNPYGQTGFAKFFDKFSKALGGKGVDYSQQFRDLDRLMGRDPGESLARFKNQQYGLYKDPKIASDGRITSGGIDQANRGTYQEPIEMVPRQMNLGEQLVRTGIGTVPFAGSFLSGLGTEEPYLASRVTPEMRERENPTLAEQLRSSLGDRLQGLASGNQQQAQAPVASGPVMGSRDPSREVDALAQSIPINTPIATPIAVEEANPQGPMMPAEFDQRLDNNTVADMLRESRVVDVPTPTSRPNIFDSTLIDQVVAERQEERDRAAAQREANRDKSLELLPGMLNQAIADSEARKIAQTEELDSVAPPPKMTPAEMLKEIISQPPSPRTGGQAQVAELDIPSIADLLNSGLLQDLLTEQGPNTSVPLGGGTLNFNVNPNNPGIEFRRPLQGKDMGVGELLSFLSRRT
tara:strand:+ start:1099 stop:2538 length:1440 start_codon:yes stop_codon:yes gene_type:complete